MKQREKFRVMPTEAIRAKTKAVTNNFGRKPASLNSK
jgi:hypothetical protein